MNKNFLFFAIIIILAALAGFWWYGTQPHIDSTGMVHAEIFDGAKDIFDQQIQLMPFRPQEILGEQIGWSSYLHIDWTAPEKEYNHYLVTITDLKTGWSRTESGEHDRASLDLSELEADNEYTIVIQACLSPTCEKWFVSQSEVMARTSKQYWQVDEQRFLPGSEDMLFEEVVFDPSISVIVGVDGQISEEDDFNNAQIYLEGGAAWMQRAVSDPGTYPQLSATLLNP